MSKANQDDLNNDRKTKSDWLYFKRKNILNKLTPFLKKWMEEYKSFQINNKRNSK